MPKIAFKIVMMKDRQQRAITAPPTEVDTSFSCQSETEKSLFNIFYEFVKILTKCFERKRKLHANEKNVIFKNIFNDTIFRAMHLKGNLFHFFLFSKHCKCCFFCSYYFVLSVNNSCSSCLWFLKSHLFLLNSTRQLEINCSYKKLMKQMCGYCTLEASFSPQHTVANDLLLFVPRCYTLWFSFSLTVLMLVFFHKYIDFVLSILCTFECIRRLCFLAV